jgi:hypothetical protein
VGWRVFGLLGSGVAFIYRVYQLMLLEARSSWDNGFEGEMAFG